MIVVGSLAACGTPAAAGPADAGTDAIVSDLSTGDGAGDAAVDMPCITDDDGDGHRALACLGDDCDDTDANRFPGNPERCDTLGHDEDCNSTSLGPDLDGDGFVSDDCCNTQATGMLACGADCDDARATVNLTALETCNGIDDDCDSVIDNGVERTFYADVDGDGYGDASMTADACSAPLGYVLASTDCDDERGMVHPGATEVCDGLVDENCDTLIDEGCTCTTGATRPCGMTRGRCLAGTQSCIAGRWETSCSGAFVGPATEICNGVDDDCNGAVDEALTAPPQAGLPPGKCYGGRAGTAGVGECRLGDYVCAGTATWECRGAVIPATTIECGTDTNCDGNSYTGAVCAAGSTRPCTVCTFINGNEPCSSSCTWARYCATGDLTTSPTTTRTWFAFGDNPAFVHPGGGTPSPGDGWNCPSTGSRYVCQTGPNATLGPGSYTVWFYGLREAGACVTVQVRGSAGLMSAASVCGPGTALDIRLPFTVPTPMCQMVNYEIISEGGGSVYARHTQVDRTTELLLDAR